MTMLCLGLRMASPRGRTECVPPRKPPPALSPGFPRKAIPARMTNPAEGRALHARRDGLRLTGASLPSATGPSLTRVLEMKGHGIRAALPRGRGDRAPPRKPPFVYPYVRTKPVGNANGLDLLLWQPLQQIEPPQCLRDIGILDGDLSQCLQDRLPPACFLHLF